MLCIQPVITEFQAQTIGSFVSISATGPLPLPNFRSHCRVKHVSAQLARLQLCSLSRTPSPAYPSPEFWHGRPSRPLRLLAQNSSCWSTYQAFRWSIFGTAYVVCLQAILSKPFSTSNPPSPTSTSLPLGVCTFTTTSLPRYAGLSLERTKSVATVPLKRNIASGPSQTGE